LNAAPRTRRVPAPPPHLFGAHSPPFRARRTFLSPGSTFSGPSSPSGRRTVSATGVLGAVPNCFQHPRARRCDLTSPRSLPPSSPVAVWLDLNAPDDAVPALGNKFILKVSRVSAAAAGAAPSAPPRAAAPAPQSSSSSSSSSSRPSTASAASSSSAPAAARAATKAVEQHHDLLGVFDSAPPSGGGSGGGGGGGGGGAGGGAGAAAAASVTADLFAAPSAPTAATPRPAPGGLGGLDPFLSASAPGARPGMGGGGGGGAAAAAPGGRPSVGIGGMPVQQQQQQQRRQGGGAFGDLDVFSM
jgi:hypothetical protein